MGHTESDTCAMLIDPHIKSHDWLESYIELEYYFTDGRKLIYSLLSKQYDVNYFFFFLNTNLAIIEVKVENKDFLDVREQSIHYAEKLKIDFVFDSANTDEDHLRLRGRGNFIDE